MKTRCKNFIQELKFDGDLLVYKPSAVLIYHRNVEIPINVVLDYQFKKVASISWITLYINKYFHGQLRPEVRVLRPMYVFGLAPGFKNELLKSLDEVIRKNLAGENIGLNHIPLPAMRDFYLHRIGKSGTRWTGMKVIYTKQSNTEHDLSDQQYVLFPEEAKKAS